jgi:Leucine-rich repeat (LRR) protein
MQSLSKEVSSELFMNKVFGSLMRCPSDVMKIWANSIVKKCEGLPLALVSVAQLLRARSDRLTPNNIEEVCTNLGYYLEMSPALEGMQKALIRTYDSLPGHDLKSCFLSLSMFRPEDNPVRKKSLVVPEDNLVRKKSLVRRWLAEGLVAKSDPDDEEKKADEYFEELINRNVIQPVDSSSRDRVKNCRINGVMLDFILHKSVSENFITLVHKDNFRRTKEVPRRISVWDADAESIRMAMEMDLSRVRSLAIFEQDGKDLGDLQRCKLLRALNLEHCKGLGDSVLDSICELLYLKYLSLRGTDVSKLPGKMYKLEALETLDIRRTGVSVVPMGVLTLPRIAHLLGRFRLPSQLSKVGTSKKMQSFFSEKSQLQTLAGFAIDQSPGFEHIMDRMTKLRKVKIWCDAAPGSSSANNTLVSSLEKRCHRNMHLNSLTIDFGDLPLHFLYSPSTPCVCNSIKLRGKLNNDGLPDFILSQHQLLELHLLSVDVCIETLADQLGKLNHLRYLKIADDRKDFGDAKFDIRSHGFQSLEHMCIQTPKKLPRVSIEVGAMPKLTYLELLCPNVENFDAKDMEKLENLKEVTLAHSVSPGTKEAWNVAAKVHVKRPTIRTSSCPEVSH